MGDVLYFYCESMVTLSGCLWQSVMYNNKVRIFAVQSIQLKPLRLCKRRGSKGVQTRIFQKKKCFSSLKIFLIIFLTKINNKYNSLSIGMKNWTPFLIGYAKGFMLDVGWTLSHKHLVISSGWNLESLLLPGVYQGVDLGIKTPHSRTTIFNLLGYPKIPP